MVDGYNKQDMKRIKNIISILAAVVIAASSCTKEGETPLKTVNQELVGDWQLSETTVEDAVVSKEVDVYLRIYSNGNFELYQKGTDQIRYDVYTGNCWSENGNLLTGEYDNGTTWETRYIVTTTSNGFTLKSYDYLEEQKYVKAEIPKDVIDNANRSTKSSTKISTPIL